MLYDDRLATVLQVVSEGAAAVRYAAQASGAAPGVWPSPDFAQQVLLEPLGFLQDLLGEDEPRRRAPRPARRRKRPAPPAPQGLPEPPDLDGFELRSSVWDPDVDVEDRPFRPAEDQAVESSSCRALLLEVVRRAAYDWVLYRSSSKLQNKCLAEDAYQWLFQEDKGTALWERRQRNGKEITAFVVICELLELDPASVRRRIRTLTERDIMGAGRPPERRKAKQTEEVLSSDEHLVFDVDVDALPNYDPMFVAEG